VQNAGLKNLFSANFVYMGLVMKRFSISQLERFSDIKPHIIRTWENKSIDYLRKSNNTPKFLENVLQISGRNMLIPVTGSWHKYHL